MPGILKALVDLGWPLGWSLADAHTWPLPESVGGGGQMGACFSGEASVSWLELLVPGWKQCWVGQPSLKQGFVIQVRTHVWSNSHALCSPA